MRACSTPRGATKAVRRTWTSLKRTTSKWARTMPAVKTMTKMTMIMKNKSLRKLANLKRKRKLQRSEAEMANLSLFLHQTQSLTKARPKTVERNL